MASIAMTPVPARPSGPARSYSQELARLADGNAATAEHLGHAERLARSLAEVHGQRGHGTRNPEGYARSVRQMFEGEEGLLRSVDTLVGRPKQPLPVEDAGRLEARAVAWRWQLRARSARQCPLAGADPRTLDYPSTYSPVGPGSGEAAADLAAVAVTYLALGIDDGDAWSRSFRPLWNGFFRAYFAASGDADLLDVAPPFFAHRALAFAASGELRRNAEVGLLRFAQAVLASPALDPDAAERFVDR